MIRVLTIRPAWAHAIFHLGKDVENRSWTTSYRGPMAIIAGKRMEPDVLLSLGIDPAAVRTGVLLGIVDLIDVVRDSRSSWAIPGDYHWMLRNPRLLLSPIPMRGSLALGTLRMDIADHACATAFRQP